MKFWNCFFVLGMTIGLSGCFEQLRPDLGQNCDPDMDDSCGDGYQCVYIESLEGGRCFPAAQSEEIADTFAEELCEQECEPGFAVDADCDCVDIDECETDPCDQNCENTEGNFICTCDSGYELQEDGITCEELLGCPPCHPNGTCNEDEKVCECRPGFSGDGVDECTDINECDENNGNCSHTCTNTSGGFVCSCDDGYVLNDDGFNCDNINDCASNPCENGGTCNDGIGGYTCQCLEGYSGDNCETNIDDCTGAPCQNGGTCVDGVNDYSCTCATGFEGENCETNSDDCTPNPCQNDGTCVDGVDAYTCNCTTGFKGADCSEDIDECAPEASNLCVNAADCQNTFGSYDCACRNLMVGDGREGGTGCACASGFDISLTDCEDINEEVSVCPTRAAADLDVNIEMSAPGDGMLPTHRFYCQVAINDGAASEPFPCSADATSLNINVASLPALASQHLGYEAFSMGADAAFEVIITLATDDAFTAQGASCTVTRDSSPPNFEVATTNVPGTDTLLLEIGTPLELFNIDDTTSEITAWTVASDLPCGPSPQSSADFDCSLNLTAQTASCTHTLSAGNKELCIQATDDVGNASEATPISLKIVEPFAISVTQTETPDTMTFDVTGNNPVTDDAPLQCWITQDGNDCNTTSAEASPCDTISVDLINAPHDVHQTLCATGTDENGLAASFAWPFWVDQCDRHCKDGQLCTIDYEQTDNFHDDCLTLMTFGYGNQTGGFGLSATPNEDTCTSIDIDAMGCYPGEVAIQVGEDSCTCKPADHTSITAYAGGFTLEIHGTQDADAGVQINHCTAELTDNDMVIPIASYWTLGQTLKDYAHNNGTYLDAANSEYDLFQNTFDLLKAPASNPASCSLPEENLADTYSRVCGSPPECEQEPACAEGERKQVTHYEDGTIGCECIPVHIDSECVCIDVLTSTSGSLYLYLVPQKIIAFEGTLSVTCSGHLADEDFNITQSFGFVQKIDGGDLCEPPSTDNPENPCGDMSDLYWKATSKDEAPYTDADSLPSCAGYNMASWGADELLSCSPHTPHPQDRVCLPDGAGKHHMCSPYLAQEMDLFRDFNHNFIFNPDGEPVIDVDGNHVTDDENNIIYTDPEFPYTLRYCKLHQYASPTAKGFGEALPSNFTCTASEDCGGSSYTCDNGVCRQWCDGDDQCNTDDGDVCINNYCTPTLPWVASENETPSERCISYPVDENGFWDLTKRPTSQHGSFISPCAADEDCATGHCVLLNANDYPNIDNDTYGCAAFMGDGQTIKHADQDFIDGCAWPMVEVQEIADETTTIKCGFPCTPDTAEEVCYHGADTCYSSNTVDTHYEGVCEMPDWDYIENCNGEQPYLYFGGAPEGDFGYHASGTTPGVELAAGKPWTWETYIYFNEDFLTGEASQVQIMRMNGHILSVSINADKDSVTWQLYSDMFGDQTFSATFGREPEGKKWDQHLKFERTSAELIVTVDGVALAPEETSETNHLNAINLLSGTAYIIGQNNNPPSGGTGFWMDPVTVSWSLEGSLCANNSDCVEGFCNATTCDDNSWDSRVHFDQSSENSFEGFAFHGGNLPAGNIADPLGGDISWSHICVADPEKADGDDGDDCISHGSNEGVEAALNLNEPGDLAMEQSPSHFSIEIAETPFSDAGEMTLGFWIEIDQAATEGQNRQIVSVNGDEAGGFAIDYKKLPSGQIEFQLILNDGPSMLTYLSHTTSPQGPIHVALAMDRQLVGSGGALEDGSLYFWINGEKVSTPGSTNNLWGSWVTNATTWTHLIFGESVASGVAPNFKLDNIRIMNGALHLDTDWVLQNFAHDMDWEYQECSDVPMNEGNACSSTNLDTYPNLVAYTFTGEVQDESSLGTFEESGTFDNIGEWCATGSFSRARLVENMEVSGKEPTGAFFSGPFTSMDLSSLNLSGTEYLVAQMSSNDPTSVFEVNDLGYQHNATHSNPEILVALINPSTMGLEHQGLEHHLSLNCDNTTNQSFRLKQMVTHQNRIYLNVEFTKVRRTLVTCSASTDGNATASRSWPFIDDPGTDRKEFILAAKITMAGDGTASWALNFIADDGFNIQDMAGGLDEANMPVIYYTQINTKAFLKYIKVPFDNHQILQIDQGIGDVNHTAIDVHDKEIFWAYTKPDSGSTEQRTYIEKCEPITPPPAGNPPWNCSDPQILDADIDGDTSNIALKDLQIKANGGEVRSIAMAFVSELGGETHHVINIYDPNDNAGQSQILSHKVTIDDGISDNSFFRIKPGSGHQIVVGTLTYDDATERVFDVQEIEVTDTNDINMRPAIEVEIPNPNDSAQLNLGYIPLPSEPALLSIGVITGTGTQSLGEEYLLVHADDESGDSHTTSYTLDQATTVSNNHGFLLVGETE